MINLFVDKLKYSFFFKGDEAVPDKDVWCWCREEEHGDMLMCEGYNVQLNGSTLVVWDYCTAQCFLGIAQTVTVGVKRLLFHLMTLTTLR